MTAYEEIATVSEPAQAGRRTSLAPAPKKGTSKLKQKEHITALAFISVKYVGLFIFTLLPLLLAFIVRFYRLYRRGHGKAVLFATRQIMARIR